MPEVSEIQKANYMRTKAVWYLCRWVGTYYTWGGSDPSGFDCSGLMIETLQAVGILPMPFDHTANGLYLMLKNKTPPPKAYAGCLVFWFKEGRAIHVEMMIDDYHTIGASGGGSKTLTRADAIRHDAFVKMRPVGYRGDNYKICDPFLVDKETP